MTTHTYTCPLDYADDAGGHLKGCGHTFDATPDDEGFVDCPSCGLWHRPPVMQLANPPYPEDSNEHRTWLQGASAALTAVLIAGEGGGEYVENLVMEAEAALGMVKDEKEIA